MSEIPLVHIASPSLEVQGVLRQRCGWCGALLIEYELANVARPLDPGEDSDNPKPWTPGTFEPGVFVRVSGTLPETFEAIEPEPHPDHPGRIRLPDGACADAPL